MRCSLLYALAIAAPVAYLSLDSASGAATWRVNNKNLSYDLGATVPGCPHLDLLRAGLIGEPYVDDNVDLLRWIADDEWTWTATFAAVPGLLGRRRVELLAEGIDTMAAITLNGAHLGDVVDAFHVVAFDVTTDLAPTSNTLTVAVASSLRSAAAAAAACVSGYCPSVARDGNGSMSGYNYIRRPAVNSGCV